MVFYATFTGLQDPSGEEGSLGRRELLCASTTLGVRETFVTQGPAGEGLPSVAAIATRLIELINQTQPDVIVTWGPDGLTGHPRHVLVSTVVTRVFQQQELLVHKPSKLYYIAYPESLFPDKRPPFGVIADGNAEDINLGAPFGTVHDRFITTIVDAQQYLDVSREAIACHRLPKGDANPQWQDNWFARLSGRLQGKVFLRLVMIGSSDIESDIFAGLAKL
jgi:LmbE family N-acetylglucosaminyl deacetylase